MSIRDTSNQPEEYNGQGNFKPSPKPYYERYVLLSLLSKKTEKIATAVYMVTDFMSESEPMRGELRTLSLDLISNSRAALSGAPERQGYLFQIEALAEETIILINLAATVGLISEMNGTILVRELQKLSGETRLINGTSSSSHPGYKGVILSEDMFDVSGQSENKENPNKGQDYDKGQINSGDVFYKKESQKHLPGESFSKKNDLGIKIARRNDVLNIIKAKGTVSIKDILLILKGVSEKTVQRELLALVKEGVLVKEGEKRWSTYRVKN